MRKLGIELENNSSTPMEAVIDLNMFVFGCSHSEAFEIMWKIHRNGFGLVAVFPESRLFEIKQRLQLFLEQMEHPVSYQIVDEPTDTPAHQVDFGSLPDWEQYSKQMAVTKRKRWVWYAIFGIIFLALASWAFLRMS